MECRPKLTRETMTRLPIGAVFPIKCNTAAELDAAVSTAYQVRRKYPRDDGGVYKVARSAKTMTVTVSVIREDESDESDKCLS